MAANDTNICNTNLLQSAKFTFSIPRLPAMQFFCQAVNIPGVNSQSTVQMTPFRDMGVPGDKMEYEDLEVTFLVDEELKSWANIYYWIKGYTQAESFQDYENLDKLSKYSQYDYIQYPQYADAILTILSSSDNKPKMRLHFIDLFPVYVSAIPLDVRVTAETTVTATATFRFKRYELTTVVDGIW
jgi:hypothetical protein